MTVPPWQDSKPSPPKIRKALPPRSDFQDSAISARREEAAVQRRRAEAMAAALRSRGLPSDPDGSKFMAMRKEAIAARRLENARLANSEPQEEEEDEDEAYWPATQVSDDTAPEVRPHRRRYAVPAIAAAIVAACALAAWRYFSQG